MLDNYLTATSELQLRQLALEEKQFEADVKLKGARLELEYEDIKLSREQRSDTIEMEMKKWRHNKKICTAEANEQRRQEIEKSYALRFKKLKLIVRSSKK